jgi:hypothetical protein
MHLIRPLHDISANARLNFRVFLLSASAGWPSFPEVPQCTSQVGRPDEGTDTAGFFNTEYLVDLKPKEQWRPVFQRNKHELTGAMNCKLNKIPDVLTTKAYGGDLKVLEGKADQILGVMYQVKGIEDPGIFRVLGQPNLNFEVDSRTIAAIKSALRMCKMISGLPLTALLSLRYYKVRRGMTWYLRYSRLLSPSGFALAQLCMIRNRMAVRKSIAKETIATSPSSIACAVETSEVLLRKRSGFRNLARCRFPFADNTVSRELSRSDAFLPSAP